MTKVELKKNKQKEMKDSNNHKRQLNRLLLVELFKIFNKGENYGR
jgi:hypothetical protein